jgi:glycosyltransferase involved in cell wall biosynthesis
MGDGNTEILKGVRVVRVGATSFGRLSFVGKLMDYLSFYGGVAWKLLTLRPRPNRVVALTTPPFLSLLVRIGSWLRGADHAHWVMDLYPDVMVAHGMLSEGGLGHRLLGFLTRFGFGGKRCAAVITLGPDMAERSGRYLAAGRSAEWVPLWATDVGNTETLKTEILKPGSEEEEGKAEPRKHRNTGAPKHGNTDQLEQAGRELRRERGWQDDELILMYSGNMGLGHRFGEFLVAAQKLKRGNARKLRFVFYGGGKRRVEIEAFIREHSDAPIELHDYVPREQLAAHLRSADIHLASLEPSWDGTMVPSKLQGIFAASRPVLFVGSESSSIGRWILESGGGWVIRPEDHEGLSGFLEEAGSLHERQRRGDAAFDFQRRFFDRTVNAARVASLLVAK